MAAARDIFAANAYFSALGSRATIPDVPGLAAAQPMTHVEALDLERLPEHLIVLGGGYVGLEFAQAMRRFGSRVTIIQRGKQLLEREDADIAAAVEELMQDEGVDVLLQSELLNVNGRSGDRVEVRVRRWCFGKDSGRLRHSRGGRANTQYGSN